MIHDTLRRRTIRSLALPMLLGACLSSSALAGGMIRHKQPDRGSYRPPVMNAQQSASKEKAEQTTRPSESDQITKIQPQHQTRDQAADLGGLPEPVVLEELDQRPSPIRQVSHESVEQAVAPTKLPPPVEAAPIASQYDQAHTVQTCSCESCRAQAGHHAVEQPMIEMGQPIFDAGCDSNGCDSMGCDSMGCNSMCGRSSLFQIRGKDWFGSAELMLMFRSGDRLPALATDGALDSANPPQIFAGQENVYKDMTAGGRLTIGTWLDQCKDRHLVGRAWFAGEQTYGFNADQNSHPTLVRPFFNVTDGVTPAQDTLIISTPNQAEGRLSIQGDSNTYGADLSIRQLWYKNCGLTVDLLYGYQYMGLDESLTISDQSISLASVPPVGSLRATTDSFDVENDFHGGQIGMASHYREGCWSFSSLAKIGFGSLRRRSILMGQTLNSIDGSNAIDPNGLLVRSTNAGTRNDDTFGWVPELDFTLGWQKYPCFDVTVGYHIIAMTDALQVSGAIDPALAVNAAVPPTGLQNPSANFRHGTFYVQGIHFGLSYIY